MCLCLSLCLYLSLVNCLFVNCDSSTNIDHCISSIHQQCPPHSVDNKYYWEIVVLLRKLCIGIIVSFFTVEPLVSIPLQFLIIFVSICMQLRWGPYISVKNRCGVCGSGLLRKVSVRCCRGANNRIELILMSAESLLLVAGFANAAVGGTGSSINGGVGTNNQTINKRSRARLATINGTNPTNSSSFSYSPSSMPPTYSVTTVIVQHSVIPVFEWLGSLLFLVGIWLGNA